MPEPLTVLGVGSWDWYDVYTVKRVCWRWLYENAQDDQPPPRLIIGKPYGAHAIVGANKIMHRLWTAWGWNDSILDVPVTAQEWFWFGREKGTYLRNDRMIDLRPDVCLAFPRRSDARVFDCVEQVVASDIPTIVSREV